MVRTAYRLASKTFGAWAHLTHPTVRGATVFVWRGDALLLVQTSYHPWQSTPGGRVERGEDPRDAAARELQEETGLEIDPEALSNLGSWIVEHSHMEDHVHVFACQEADTTGTIAFDRREIVGAEFVPLQALSKLELWPPLRTMLGQGLRPLEAGL